MKIHVFYQDIAFEAPKVNLVNSSTSIKLVYIGLSWKTKHTFTIRKCWWESKVLLYTIKMLLSETLLLPSQLVHIHETSLYQFILKN